MNRLLVLGGAGIAALLLLHRPPAPAAAISTTAAATSQHFRKGHPSASAAPKSVVYVAGAVKRPGLYTVASGARINDAIALAGGFGAQADDAAINLAQRVTDGEEIRVPRIGEAIASAGPRARSTARKPHAPPPAQIDLNAADAAALASLPGIGDTLAQRIVEYRTVNGPFASLDELADVSGMTQRRIDAVSQYLTLSTTR